MKKLKTSLGIAALLVATFIATSCDNSKGESGQQAEGHSAMNHETTSTENSASSKELKKGSDKNSKAEVIVNTYLELKDALFADNAKQAAEAGKKLATAFESFDASTYTSAQQQELSEIVEDAKEHAQHIAESEIAHQREHFAILSKDIVDMIAITGASKTLYQQLCPMYNNNKGGIWISSSKEIQNPYFGPKMPKCGEVQKEI